MRSKGWDLPFLLGFWVSPLDLFRTASRTGTCAFKKAHHDAGTYSPPLTSLREQHFPSGNVIWGTQLCLQLGPLVPDHREQEGLLGA